MTSANERIVGLLKEARRELEAARQMRSQPIAVVGMSCRFPGAAGLGEFWRLLRNGVDATREVPVDRWDADALYDADPDKPGKLYVKRGGFLDQIDLFDPEFFGISPREAVGMDPQHRLLLEVAWEAIEDAGIPASALKGTSTGVWVGLCLDDYARRSITSGDLERIDPYNALGNTRSVAAGRIAYVLDLKGPVVQLDTACSSSLVAVHQGCQSLRSGESDTALVGGVNLMSSPETTVALCRLRALSADGRCKTFDDSADGYGRGEGCGMVVLKRLADARASGDKIYAVIRGSATNHDGRSNGLTAPNGLSQEAVIRAALANGGLAASAVEYVETHGTGTLLGDPIEVLALSRAYGEGRSSHEPLTLGAVKANLGHLEGAAGIAGLIKLALCLERGQMAPQIHVNQPNRTIPWERLPVRVSTEARDWPRNGRARAGAVSAFGLSGTNVHVVMEEGPSPDAPDPDVAAPAPAPALPVEPARDAELVVLSARTPAALQDVARRLREHLLAQPALELRDVAYSLATTRSLLDRRLPLVVPTRDALLDALARAGSQASSGPRAASGLGGKLAWLFTGQGAQQVGMGQTLYAQWSAFREAFDEALLSIDPLLDRPLREVMWAAPGSADAALLGQTGYTQPALFVLEWALSQLWRSWGVTPDVVCGHSIGEISAACVAGVFSLSDAARLVCARARLMQALPPGGAMVSITSTERDVAETVARFAGSVSIAAVNAPTSVVIAGAEPDVLAIAEGFAARGVACKRLAVSHAFHSPLMEPMLAKFAHVAESLTYHAPRIPLISNLTGTTAGAEVLTARYWVAHVREPVRFSKSVQSLHVAGARCFIELGPRPTLLPLVHSTLSEADLDLLPALRAGSSETVAVLEALGGWISCGGALHQGIYPGGGRRVTLPTYPWQRTRYWIEPSAARTQPWSADLREVLRELASASTLSDLAKAQMPAILAALDERMSRATPAHARGELFQALEWRAVPLPAAAERQPGAWVVHGHGPELGALREAFEHAGCACRVTADVQALRAALSEREVRGVIHVLAPTEEPSLALAQLAASRAEPLRTWWVTRGAVSTGAGDPPLRPGQALCWGLGRTLALEAPRAWGGILDVPGPLRRVQADQIVAFATCNGTRREDQVALREHGAYAARLVQRAPLARRRARIGARGTVLVTGGLGGLGLHVARWLARSGARRLLLVARKGLATPGADAALAELRALGTAVDVAAADVCDAAAMSAALAQIPADEDLSAIFHVAGVSDTTPLGELSVQRWEQVVAAKRRGTEILDELTRARALDAFVCFSSISGVWGSGHQAAYSAANAFLDAWAQAARAQNRPALSIAWGPWRGEGMADASSREYLERRGIRALEPSVALAALQQALDADIAHTVVVDVDWAKFRVGFEAWGPRPLLLEMGSSGVVAAAGEGDGRLVRELEKLPQRERVAHVRAWLAEQCAVVLGHAEPSRLELQRGLFDLGMDSLMLVELRRRLSRALGSDVPPGVMFSHPSIMALAEHVASELLPSPAQPELTATQTDELESDELDSDEDVLRFINEKFERGG